MSNGMLTGLLGAAKGGSEEYLKIQDEDRAEERKIAGEERATERSIEKEGRAQDVWELRQKRLDEYGISGEKRRSGLVESREISKEKRETKREEKDVERVAGAMEESREQLDETPYDDVGPVRYGEPDEEVAAGLLTQSGRTGLAKEVRESKGKTTSATSSADERMAEVYAKEKGWSMGEALDYVSQQKRENPKKAALEWVKIRQKEQSDNSVYKEIRKGVPNPAYKTAEQLRDEAMNYFGGAKKPGAKGDMLGKPPAADHKGRTIIDSETGVQYKSNGSKWVKVG